MSKAYILPAVVVVAATPNAAHTQSYPSTVVPPPPIYAPPAMPAPSPWPPAPPSPRIAMPGGPKGNPGAWFTDDDYPPDAKRAGESGRVAIILSIDTAGRITDCRVFASSGSASLDAATCRLAQRRGRFYVRKDIDGTPLPYTYPISTRWVLRDPDSLDFNLGTTTVDLGQGPFSQTLSVIVVDVDEEGVATSCRSGLPSVSTVVACSDFSVGRWLMSPVVRDGKPVRATVTLTRSIRVDAPTITVPPSMPRPAPLPPSPNGRRGK